ncbi:hypothetical protein YC2023_031747 [Brassica napus]
MGLDVRMCNGNGLQGVSVGLASSMIYAPTLKKDYVRRIEQFPAPFSSNDSTAFPSPASSLFNRVRRQGSPLRFQQRLVTHPSNPTSPTQFFLRSLNLP